MSDNDNDSDVTMGQICRKYGKSIVDLLIDIQESQIEQQKYLPFVRNLDCLCANPYQRTRLSRQSLDAFDTPEYVALSYTWEASEYEDPSCGRYLVQNRDRHGNSFDSSGVRNCVFDRILKYMRNFGLQYLWIDFHSLQQAVCDNVNCEHMECSQNREGLDAMDLVYQLSEHPVALLSTPIESPRDLDLLIRILGGNLVSHNQLNSGFQLSRQTNPREVIRALRLLSKLTKDRWWTRGWIFQESYRAGGALCLLVPHSSGLERLKLSNGTELFGNVRGELRVNATSFSYEATRLCLAFDEIESPPPWTQIAISQIIATAGRYTLILQKHMSMSPTIFSDISKRDLKQHWDQLAIAANCCQYSTRLDVQELKHKRHSFSLSKLALCLLNGELLFNHRLFGLPSRMTVLKFLSSQSFKGYYAPLNQRSLSFNKGCRLNHVELTSNGILTKGHLWSLGKTIYSHEIKRQSSWVDDPTGRLSLHSRKRLAQLARTLHHMDHDCLKRHIWEYLERDSASEADRRFDDTFPGFYMQMMAAELVSAIDRGMALRLACLWEPSGQPSKYRAIFICESDKDELTFNRSGAQHRVPSYGSSMVFTASAPRRRGTTEHEVNDLDRHVSLEVRYVGSFNETGGWVPGLAIESWILGLCFFRRISTTDVLFPWPPGFKSIAP